MSQVKFNNKRNTSAFNNALQFIPKFSNFTFNDIGDGIL